MKKLICICLCAVIALSLTACFPNKYPIKEPGDDKQTSQRVESDETFGLNETAAFSKLKFTATEIVESDGEGFFAPESGNVYIGVKFVVENISEDNQSVSSLMLFQGYVDNVKCPYSFNANCVFDEGTLDGTLAPGKRLVGWYAMEVPKNWSCIELQVQSSIISNNPAKFVFNK